MKRRTLLNAAFTIPTLAIPTLAIPTLAMPSLARAQVTARVVVVGGGFGGATAARALAATGRFDVTLIDSSPTYTACPFSNEVIIGERSLSDQRFAQSNATVHGIRVVQAIVVGVDPAARRVDLRDHDGSALPSVSYDRLVLSPGVDMIWNAVPGYDEPATERMPHAWKAGAQTLKLRDQLRAMPDGGLVVITAPANPYRCPPGPYERASLIGHYLKTQKPKSKLILLDAKDVFSKQKLFQQAWANLYPGIVEWVSQSNGGAVTSVDAKAMTVSTDFQTWQADVANIIPPQRAALIAQRAGVADKTGWCPVDPITFESRLQAGIHVIGDAALAGAMPKSAFAANAQAKICAAAVVALLVGDTPQEPRLLNTCYSLVAPDYGISVAGVYRPSNGVLTEIEGSGGTSPLDAPKSTRAAEANFAAAWFAAITGEAFG